MEPPTVSVLSEGSRGGAQRSDESDNRRCVNKVRNLRQEIWVIPEL